MSSRTSQPTKNDKGLRVPKAALVPLQNAYNLFMDGQKQWTQSVAVAAAFLDLDPADVLSIDLATGIVSLRPKPTLVKSEPEGDAQTG